MTKLSKSPFGLVPEIRIGYENTNIFDVVPNENDEITIPIIRKKALDTSFYLEKLIENFTFNQKNHLIPPNCRYIQKVDQEWVVVLEESPCYRTIITNQCLDSQIENAQNHVDPNIVEFTNQYIKEYPRPPYKFTLAIPYFVFVLRISKFFEVISGKVFFRPNQLIGPSDMLFKVPFPNINDSGQSVCWGDKIYGKHRSMFEVVNHVTTIYWSAIFNNDFNYNQPLYNKNNLLFGNYFEYQYVTNNDPMRIFRTDYLPYKQLSEVIKHFIKNEDNDEFDFKRFLEISQDPFNTGKEETINDQSDKKFTLYYDICQSVYLTDDCMINVGDDTQINGKTAYIDSFIGFAEGGGVRYIQIEIEKRKYLLKYTTNCKEFLYDKFKLSNELIECKLNNGNIIKVNDIVEVNINNEIRYFQVEHIRKSKDLDEGIYEIKLDRYYFLSNTLNAKLLDRKAPITINNIEVKIDDEIFLNENNSNDKIIEGRFLRYKQLNVNNGRVRVEFECLDENDRYITNLDNLKNSQVLLLSKLIKLPPVYRINSTLVFNDQNQLYEEMFTDGEYIYHSYFKNEDLSIPTEFLQNLIIDNKTLSIPGLDFDIEFNIGDKVVVANWKTPEKLLLTQQIQGFLIENQSLYFQLIDKNGTETKIKYINNNVVHVGKIRLVTNRINMLTVGTKIKPKVTGIPGFLKKDCHIIVAFIIDTGTIPLVLCSNGLTLWYNDVLEKFDIIPYGDPKWAKLQHAPLDYQKIKLQAGDVFYDNYRYLISGFKNLYCTKINYYDGNSSSSAPLFKYITPEYLDCILAPRISKVEPIKCKGINFHSFEILISNNPDSYNYIF